jgi:hypothetical protein
MFASRIKCGECGSWYGSKIWHSTTKYRRTIYQCNRKFKDDKKCSTPHLDEEAIKRLFVSAVNKLLADKDEIIANFGLVKADLFGTESLEAENAELQSEMTITAELIQKCIDENAHIALDQAEYQERYEGFVAELGRQDGLIADFDDRLWYSLVDFATVYSENDVRFTFKNGVEIQA